MILTCSIPTMILLLVQFASAFVLLPDDWEETFLTMIPETISSSAEELSSDPQQFVIIGDQRYPVRDASEFRAWNTKIWSGGAAFDYGELLLNPAFFPFHVNSLDSVRNLSNLATTPFCFEDLEVQSVESLIFAHYARAYMHNERLASRISRMDGLSARQVGKHFTDRPSRNQIQSFVESKLIQCPKIYKMAKSLIDEGMLLVCTDQTSFDYRGLDRQFGMVRHGRFLVGDNMLGKIYHALHKEM